MLIESNIIKLIDPGAAVTQSLPLPEALDKDIEIKVLRLDLVHPVISGNKFFKLRYFLEDAIAEGKKGIASFGGAWSNHLVALAYACQQLGLESVGLVRGDPAANPSGMLTEAESYGMKLHYISREQYRDKPAVTREFASLHPEFVIVPEGGSGTLGIRGAEQILPLANPAHADLICCPVGTGTMLAGILRAAADHQQVIGFSSLKLNPGNDVDAFIRAAVPGREFSINYDYHLGGYARKTPELISFMNELWKEYALPTDFVYTAKMIYGLREMVVAGRFPAGKKILAIQSGGLQGNRSIKDELIF